MESLSWRMSLGFGDHLSGYPTYQASALFLHSLRPRAERVEGPKVNDVKTMMIYTHVLNRGGQQVRIDGGGDAVFRHTFIAIMLWL
jgi:hypothetical protein